MESAEKLITTRISKETLRAEWEIRNMDHLLTKEISTVKSPELLSCTYGNWFLVAELSVQSKDGCYNYDKNQYIHVKATTWKLNRASAEFPSSIKAGIVPESGQPNLIELRRRFVQQEMTEFSELCTCCTLNDLKNEQNGYARDNTLTVVFEISQWYFEHAQSLKNPIVPKKAADPSKGATISKYFPFLMNKELTDFEVRVQEKVISVHKVILAAASPVFAAMFTSELKESRDNRLEITDCSAEAFGAFINFIYAGESSIVPSLATELLGIAHKYQVGSLSSVCEDVLTGQLDVERAANTLLLAHVYQAKQLEEAAKAYIVANFKQIILTNDWKTLLEQNAQLVYEVMQQLSTTLA